MSSTALAVKRAVLLPATLLPASNALAHSGQSHDGSIWLQWDFSPDVVIPILLGATIYGIGLWRLWRRAGVGRGISRWQAANFCSGMLVLVAALLSPLEAVSSVFFSWHMVQHLLLIVVAPPLLVTGAADVAVLWALPMGWRGRFGRFERGIGRGMLHGVRTPIVIILLATGMLWVWHVPFLYDLALRVEAVHVAEHAGFLITSLLFWTLVLRLRPHDRDGNGLRILYVFAVGLQGSLLGALITFAGRPLYPSHALATAAAGQDPLVDQQLAGLLMWIPPALLYVGLVAWLFVSWLRALETRRQRPASTSIT